MHACACMCVCDFVCLLQVDVLEAQFSQLTEKIQSTHDFESIKHAHESFVTTLQSQLFFTMPAVSSSLTKHHNYCSMALHLYTYNLALSPGAEIISLLSMQH